MVTINSPYHRLASKTTDVNWTKKDIEEQYGYYENRCVGLCSRYYFDKHISFLQTIQVVQPPRCGLQQDL